MMLREPSMIAVEFTAEEVEAVHHALYLRLRELSMVEDHNPDPRRRSQAQRQAAPVITAAAKLQKAQPNEQR